MSFHKMVVTDGSSVVVDQAWHRTAHGNRLDYWTFTSAVLLFGFNLHADSIHAMHTWKERTAERLVSSHFSFVEDEVLFKVLATAPQVCTIHVCCLHSVQYCFAVFAHSVRKVFIDSCLPTYSTVPLASWLWPQKQRGYVPPAITLLKNSDVS